MGITRTTLTTSNTRSIQLTHSIPIPERKHLSCDQNTSQPRIFKIGATRIIEDASLAGRDLDEVKAILQRTYPEIAHAAVRETTLEDGTKLFEWLSQPGRKG